MQTHSSPRRQLRSTIFGSREPEAYAAAARADLAACRAALRNGSRTFLAAARVLPRRVHEPASALYAFCRLADDAVDAQGARGPAGSNAVERLRERVRLAYAGTPVDDPADRALAIVVVRHAIPIALFDALLEGFAWDLEGRRYETLEALHDYGARVAGTVGAMMALLMGARGADGLARACDLGVAMQLSNIARDVGEDARMGRLYLPRQWLREAGIDPDAWLARPVHTPALAGVVERLLAAAQALYSRAGAGVARLPLDCRPGINAARFMYAEIGHEVARRGHDAVSSRARVTASRKALLLARALLHVAPSPTHLALPPLAANRFLVDAAGLAGNVNDGPRGLAARVAWTVDLFGKLEQRRHPDAGGAGREHLTT